MKIRPAESGDFDAVADITNHFILNTAIHFGTEAQSPDEHRSVWLATRDRYPFLVAEEAGRVVAYAKAYRWRERAAYERTTEVGVYVRLGLEGGGRGTAVYSALLDELPKRGFHVAMGVIALPNEPSERLHAKLGFTRAGVFREVGRKFEKWWDVAFWEKRL